MLLSLCLSVGLMLGLAGASAFLIASHQQSLQAWGIISNILTVMYYAAPLSSIRQVLQQRSAASICLANNVTNLLNAVFWIVYGVAIGDIFVWLPNVPGLAIAPVLIALSRWYPNSEDDADRSLRMPLLQQSRASKQQEQAEAFYAMVKQVRILRYKVFKTQMKSPTRSQASLDPGEGCSQDSSPGLQADQPSSSKLHSDLEHTQREVVRQLDVEHAELEVSQQSDVDND